MHVVPRANHLNIHPPRGPRHDRRLYGRDRATVAAHKDCRALPRQSGRRVATYRCTRPRKRAHGAALKTTPPALRHYHEPLGCCPYADLHTARAWLTALGLTVAPSVRGPAIPSGTKRTLSGGVYFGERHVFLLRSPWRSADTAEKISDGESRAPRDQCVQSRRMPSYRLVPRARTAFRRFVFKSEDAGGRSICGDPFEQAGITGSGTRMLRCFSNVPSVDGPARLPRAPRRSSLPFGRRNRKRGRGLLFTCQRLGQPKVDRKRALEAATNNGALAIKAIIAEGRSSGNQGRGFSVLNPAGLPERRLRHDRGHGSQQGSNLTGPWAIVPGVGERPGRVP